MLSDYDPARVHLPSKRMSRDEPPTMIVKSPASVTQPPFAGL